MDEDPDKLQMRLALILTVRIVRVSSEVFLFVGLPAKVPGSSLEVKSKI